MPPKHILFVDIDGLRVDVFSSALRKGEIPNIARLFGGKGLKQGLKVPCVAPAPSITFCAQASLFTGEHPKTHGVVGNQFFDRFGEMSGGTPRFYAFDIGETLEVDDAVKVYTHGLAAERLQVPTFYKKMRSRGLKSVVAGNMYAKGANKWIKPSLTRLARFVKGKNLFGLTSAEFDRDMAEKVIAYIDEHGLPDILTLYFLAVDQDSHKKGPRQQKDTLVNVIDPLVGKIWDKMLTHAQGSIFVSLFSDHGQIEVIKDDEHALRIGFPFDREMGHFFDALNLDVHDYPGEDPDCDAVMALNGGVAQVYLHNKTGHWRDRPLFERDVLPIGRAFWEAHETGKYAADLKGTLSAVLLRDVEHDGWEASFQALTPEGEVVSLADWFAQQPTHLYVDPVNRINNSAGRFAGDLFLISNYADQYYFGTMHKGIHGGLHPDDSLATLVYGWFGVSPQAWKNAKEKIADAIQARCERENGRHPAVVDMVTGVEAILDAD